MASFCDPTNDVALLQSCLLSFHRAGKYCRDAKSCASDTTSGVCVSLPISDSSEASDCPRERSLCMLCEEPVRVKLIPCGHAEICEVCVKRATKCPHCKVYNNNLHIMINSDCVVIIYIGRVVLWR